MKRRFAAVLLPWFACLLLLLAGCSSYTAQALNPKALAGVKAFFVQANSNDNHGIARQIQLALQAEGCTAETGPLTMMPDDAKLIITYDDRWSWDFGDYLGYMQITARNRSTQQAIASATYSAKIPGKKNSSAIIGELVEQLLATAKH